jgi:hypothetical protein
MTWVVWRQHRNQAYFAGAALALFAILLLVTGAQMASQYHSALTSCTTSHTCSNLANTLSLGSPVLTLLINLTLLVPCLLGAFWGGPLVARELESGTSQFLWMQSITRRRWFVVTVGWILLAAALWAGAVSALVTWWSSPVNALNQQGFQPGQFDVQGIVPVGYALFAVALGIAAGAILRRTVAALATTVGVFAAVRIVIAEYLRPHYMTAVSKTYALAAGELAPVLKGSDWVVSRGVVAPDGRLLGSQPGRGVGISLDGTFIRLPPACRALLQQGPPKMLSCLSTHGYRLFVAYQPANRYWEFQGIETGIYIALAAALVAVTATVVLRRDT